MKKIIAIILSVLMLFSVTACSSDSKKDVDKHEKATSDNRDDKPGREDSTEKVSRTVSFTLPKLGEDEYSTELTQEQIDAGFLSVEINEDGSATYTMSRHDWLIMLDEMRTTGLDSILNTSEDGYESFYSYEISEEFDSVTLYVDYNLYQSSEDPFALFSVMITMSMIQCVYGISSDEVGFTLNIADYQTQEIVDTINLPDDLES